MWMDSISASAIASSRGRARAGRVRSSCAFARLALLLAALAAVPALADDIYQQPDAFVRDAFAHVAPEPALLWIAGPLREQVRAILGHEPPALRTRYWRAGDRTAWVLEEVGKEQPITVGLIVAAGRLERVRVLAYRETRGVEVRLDFFTRQFDGAALDGEARLDRRIDNISGATLSVNAMRKLAQLALLYHAQVMGQVPAP